MVVSVLQSEIESIGYEEIARFVYHDMMHRVKTSKVWD